MRTYQGRTTTMGRGKTSWAGGCHRRWLSWRNAVRTAGIRHASPACGAGARHGRRVALSEGYLVRVFGRLRLLLSREAQPTRERMSFTVSARRWPWRFRAFEHGIQNGWATHRHRQDDTFGGDTDAALGRVDGLGRVKDERPRHGRAREVERHVEQNREHQRRVPPHTPHPTRHYTALARPAGGVGLPAGRRSACQAMAAFRSSS